MKTDPWIATVLMALVWERRAEAAAHAAIFSGNAADASPAFFSRRAEDQEGRIYGVAVARVRASTLDALPSVRAYYGDDAIYEQVAHTVPQTMAALGLQFTDEEDDDVSDHAVL